MFETKIYLNRRSVLKQSIEKGIVLFMGNKDSPMNYNGNPYPYRQDSNFLYFWGLDVPGLNAVIDIDENKEIIFGDDFGIDDIIWMGDQPSLKSEAERAGVIEIQPSINTYSFLDESVKAGRVIHYLPPYRTEHYAILNHCLKLNAEDAKRTASVKLIKSIISLRETKSSEEIKEIEIATNVTHKMQSHAMRIAKPGIYERHIAGQIQGIAIAENCYHAFPYIVTKHGEILHNHYVGNILKDGDLILIDAGAESPRHYAGDITRTFPVNGKFTQKQKEIYEIVLAAQLGAIKLIKPGLEYQKIHLETSKMIAEGLKSIGLMHGDMSEAVSCGAHALFFPHGLGHMIGLDAHDMEGLGEDFVGYDESIKRSDQFGLAYLRLARRLERGFTITVEPGIYFIPTLIDQWKTNKKYQEYINFSRLHEYMTFGGIRIEDDVLVTDQGHRVLGNPAPKLVQDVEDLIMSE